MATRNGASLIETLVVLAIIGVLLGMLFPALQSSRQRALEIECKNNLHQLDLAVAQFAETQKRLPGPGANGFVGGWSIDILPFLEQINLQARVTPGSPIAKASDFLLRQPPMFRCPMRSVYDVPAANTMDQAHYVLSLDDKRKSFRICDAPLELKVPWASGPEVSFDFATKQTGPHHGGFFFSR